MKRLRIPILALFVLGGAAALAWKVWPRTPLPQPPALDPSGVDPVVWRAVAAAREKVQSRPQSAAAWGQLGMVLLAHQFRNEALPCLARAEQLDPGDGRWPYYQALALRRSDPEATIAHLRRALAAGPEHVGPRLLLAEMLVQRGGVDEAEAIFRAVLEREPDNRRACLGLAQAAFERDDLAVCRERLGQAADDPHTRKAARTFLAEVEQRCGDRPAAEKVLSQARDLPDDLPWPDPLAEEVQALVVGHLEVVTRAASLLQQDRLREAIPLLQRAVEDYPESSWARILLGRAWLRGGNLAAAGAVFQEAVRRAPEAVEAQFYLGVVLSEQKQWEAAIPYFREAARLKPDHALAWYNLGFCRKQQGDRSGAREAFRTAIACKPQFAEARVNLGELLAQEGQIDAALEQLRQAIRLAPDDPRARRLLESVQKQVPSSRK
jgi:tetratricopeptide (TPR) repeat protein